MKISPTHIFIGSFIIHMISFILVILISANAEEAFVYKKLEKHYRPLHKERNRLNYFQYLKINTKVASDWSALPKKPEKMTLNQYIGKKFSCSIQLDVPFLNFNRKIGTLCLFQDQVESSLFTAKATISIDGKSSAAVEFYKDLQSVTGFVKEQLDTLVSGYIIEKKFYGTIRLFDMINNHHIVYYLEPIQNLEYYNTNEDPFIEVPAANAILFEYVSHESTESPLSPSSPLSPVSSESPPSPPLSPAASPQHSRKQQKSGFADSDPAALKSSKPDKSFQPPKSGESTKSAKSGESAKSTESFKSIESPESLESLKSVEYPESEETKKPINSIKSVSSIKCTASTKSHPCSAPPKSTDSIESARAHESTNSSKKPTDSLESAPPPVPPKSNPSPESPKSNSSPESTKSSKETSNSLESSPKSNKKSKSSILSKKPKSSESLESSAFTDSPKSNKKFKSIDSLESPSFPITSTPHPSLAKSRKKSKSTVSLESSEFHEPPKKREKPKSFPSPEHYKNPEFGTSLESQATTESLLLSAFPERTESPLIPASPASTEYALHIRQQQNMIGFGDELTTSYEFPSTTEFSASFESLIKESNTRRKRKKRSTTVDEPKSTTDNNKIDKSFNKASSNETDKPSVEKEPNSSENLVDSGEKSRNSIKDKINTRKISEKDHDEHFNVENTVSAGDDVIEILPYTKGRFDREIFDMRNDHYYDCTLCIWIQSNFADKFGYGGGLKFAAAEIVKIVSHLNWIFRSIDFNNDGIPENIGFVIDKIVVSDSIDLGGTKGSGTFSTNILKLETNVLSSVTAQLKNICSESCCAILGFIYHNMAPSISTTNRRGLCGERNVALISGYHHAHKVALYDVYRGMFHAMGHLFGAPHNPTFDLNCFDSTISQFLNHFVMHPTHQINVGIRPNSMRFSLCSKIEITRFLTNKGSSCLKENKKLYCGNGIKDENEECDCGNPVQCRSPVEGLCCGLRDTLMGCKMLTVGIIKACPKSFMRLLENIAAAETER